MTERFMLLQSLLICRFCTSVTAKLSSCLHLLRSAEDLGIAGITSCHMLANTSNRLAMIQGARICHCFHAHITSMRNASSVLNKCYVAG